MEADGTLLPTPTARTYGTNRSPSTGARARPSPHRLASDLPPSPTTGHAHSVGSTTAGKATAAPKHPSQAPPAAGQPLPRPGDATRHGTAALLPTPRASDGVKGSPAQRGSHGDRTLPSTAAALDPNPSTETFGHHARPWPSISTTPTINWGPYTAAIAGWERILGRPCPALTQPGKRGQPVLAPRWVEWLMGLPDEWVTGLDLPRTVALRLLGNGVVPQQATAALRTLLIIHTQHDRSRP